VRRAVWRRRLLLVVRVGGSWYRRAGWKRRRGERRRRGGRSTLCELNVIRRSKAVAGALADQRPVWVGGVVDVENGVFLERELFVGLAVVVVESSGLRDGRGLCMLSDAGPRVGVYGHWVPGMDTQTRPAVRSLPLQCSCWGSGPRARPHPPSSPSSSPSTSRRRTTSPAPSIRRPPSGRSHCRSGGRSRRWPGRCLGRPLWRRAARRTLKIRCVVCEGGAASGGRRQ
jgi:hypothetical protein